MVPGGDVVLPAIRKQKINRLFTRKVIKRKAYGYHDEKCFSLKVIPAFAHESGH